MTRTRRRGPARTRSEVLSEPAFVAGRELDLAREKLRAMSAEEGLASLRAADAVARVIATSSPGSRLRALTWRQVVQRLANGQLTPLDCRAPTWPNKPDETLVT